ncbi:hypothetical protein PG990_015420 [Apiospora arundinis]
MPGDSESNNPFVRFKHRVDDQISQTVRGIWSPSSSSSPKNATTASAHDESSASALSKTGHTNDLAPMMGSGGGPFSSPDEFSTLESAVARSLRDKTVESWVQHSAYSPLLLQYSLPQPLPKDVKSGPREGRFTFRDAFEDLLAVSSGQPLADLESRPKLIPEETNYGSGGELDFHTPLLQPPFGVFGSMRDWYDWEASLERRRLWDAYFPPASFAPAARRIATVATSDLFRRELTADQAERHIRQYIRDAAACDEERAWRRQQLLYMGGPSSPILGLLGMPPNGSSSSGGIPFAGVFSNNTGGSDDDFRFLMNAIQSAGLEMLREVNTKDDREGRPVTDAFVQRLIRLGESIGRDIRKELGLGKEGEEDWHSMQKGTDIRDFIRLAKSKAEEILKEMGGPSSGKTDRPDGADADTAEDLYRETESDFARRLGVGSDRKSGLVPLPPPVPNQDKKNAPTVVTALDDAAARQQEVGGWERGTTNLPKSEVDKNGNAEWTEEIPESDGGKTVKSVARRVGPWMTHETVTTTRYDAQGNVVQRMTQRQHSASKEFKWSSSSSYEAAENREDEKTTEEDNKSSTGKGWFWTK